VQNGFVESFDGRRLPVKPDSLFSIMGNKYGGNGTTNFRLPTVRIGSLSGDDPNKDNFVPVRTCITTKGVWPSQDASSPPLDDSHRGEILLTAGDWCPSGTREANGRLLKVSTNNSALWKLLKNRYGGVGSTTFRLLMVRIVSWTGRSTDVDAIRPIRACIVTRGAYPT